MPTPIRGGGIIRITLNIVPQSYPTIYFRHSQHNPSITVLSQSVDIHRPSYELEHRQKSIFFPVSANNSNSTFCFDGADFQHNLDELVLKCQAILDIACSKR